MPLGTPILLTLYGENDEELATYSRARVPVSFAERAIEFSGSLANGDLDQNQLMALYQIIVDFYGNKFSIEDLRRGADLGELISVIMGISARVSELMPAGANPTKPGKTRK